MSLRDTEKELYNKNREGFDPRDRRFTYLSPSKEDPFVTTIINPKEREQRILSIKEKEEKRRALFKKRVKVATIFLGISAALGVLILGVLFLRRSSFSEEKVKVTIDGPRTVKSGELVAYSIKYTNSNRGALEDAVLRVNYSENFKPQGNLSFESEGEVTSKYNIGNIKGGETREVQIKGKLFGSKDMVVYIEAELEYKGSGISSKFKSSQKIGITVTSSPLLIEVEVPLNVASGNQVTYLVKYQNSGQEEMKDLKVKVEYPRGFTYLSSEPLPMSSENNIWYAGNLSPGQKGEIKVVGSLEGQINEVRQIKAFIGIISSLTGNFISYNETSSSTKVIGAAVEIKQEINGKSSQVSVNAGDGLLVKIKYKNTSGIGLRDVVITEELRSPIIDFSGADFKGGVYDEKKGLVVWTGGSNDELKVLDPSEEGEITFVVRVKEVIPISSSKDQNISFNAVAKLDSPDIPTPEGANKIIPSNSIAVKLNSKLVVKAEGYFNDANVENSGPIPLEVGRETTFAIHLKATNVSNNITDAKVSMFLPSNVKWKNNFLPQKDQVSFNERTGELVWNIGSLPAGTGIFTDPLELIFQVGITPSQDQAGAYPVLLSKVTFTAKDAFTKEDLKTEPFDKNTSLTEDISVGDGGRVKVL